MSDALIVFDHVAKSFDRGRVKAVDCAMDELCAWLKLQLQPAS